MRTSRWFVLVSVLFTGACAAAADLVSQQPVSGGGVSRWSQLWQDPGPDGNDLDGDSVCWEDFVLTAQKSISHIEWWGNGACELGFQIEIWRQDPGTIAYQPLSVWYYGGGSPPPTPTAKFTTTSYTTSPGPGGLTHYVLNLATPITLAANTGANPRWFIGIIGLTHQAYYTWNWAQGTGGSTKTYQFIRGGTAGGGNLFWALPEGRALVLRDNLPPPCPSDLSGDGQVDGADLGVLLGQWATAGTADLNGDGSVDGADLGALLGSWGACP